MTKKTSLPKQRYIAVVLHPKTLLPFKRPPKNKPVVYGAIDTRRANKIVPLNRNRPQRFSLTDFKGLSKVVKEKKKLNLRVYESNTSENKKNSRGQVLYRTIEKGKVKLTPEKGRGRVPVKTTKITFDKPAREVWRPVYLKGSKRVREIDYAMMKRSKFEQAQYDIEHEAKRIEPELYKVTEATVKGSTIKEAMSKIFVPVTIKQLKKMKVEKIGVQGVVRVAGEEPIPFRTSFSRIADMPTKVSASIRSVMGSRGLRFTKPVKLSGIRGDVAKEIKSQARKYQQIKRQRNAAKSEKSKAAFLGKMLETGRHIGALKKQLTQIDLPGGHGLSGLTQVPQSLRVNFEVHLARPKVRKVKKKK